MEITTKKVDDLNVNVAITIAPDDYENDYNNALKAYRKQVKMPGFRPGNVPMGLVKKMYGKSLLAEELNKKLSNTLFDHIAKEKLSVLGQPLPLEDEETGDWENPGTFTFNYEIGLAPEIDVDKALKKLPARYKIEVSDKMVDDHVEDLTRRHGAVDTVETSEDEDILMATLIELNENNEVKEGGIMNDSSVLIREVTDKKTKESLIGLAAEAEVVVNPHHLTASHDDLATMLGVEHADVHDLSSNFKLRVKEVKRLTPKAVEQDLFDMVFGKDAVDSEEAFRSKLREELEKMFDRDAERFFRNQLHKGILEQLDAPLPEAFLKRWMKSVNEKPLSDDDLESQFPEYAKYVRWQIFEEEIIKRHNIEVTTEDVVNESKAQIAMQYSRYGLPLDDEMLNKFAQNVLSDRKEYDRLRDSLRENKMFEALIDSLKLKEKKVSYDDFVKIVEEAGK